MMALSFSLKVQIQHFSYAETPYRPTWEILYGKAGTGGFFAHFEP